MVLPRARLCRLKIHMLRIETNILRRTPEISILRQILETNIRRPMLGLMTGRQVQIM